MRKAKGSCAGRVSSRRERAGRQGLLKAAINAYLFLYMLTVVVQSMGICPRLLKVAINAYLCTYVDNGGAMGICPRLLKVAMA